MKSSGIRLLQNNTGSLGLRTLFWETSAPGEHRGKKKRTLRLKHKRRKMRQWSKQTWTPREYPGAETRKPWGQGRWYKLLDASLPSRAYPSRSRTFYAVLITSAIPRPTLLIAKRSLLVLCPGPVTLWMSSVLRCAECDACTINYLLS